VSRLASFFPRVWGWLGEGGNCEAVSGSWLFQVRCISVSIVFFPVFSSYQSATDPSSRSNQGGSCSSKGYSASLVSSSSMPMPGSVGTLMYHFSISRGFFTSECLGGASYVSSSISSCRTKLDIHASSCTHAAVETARRGLCGTTLT
jgi:hypothetical protein